MKRNPDQYILPFEAARGELLSQIRMLHDVELGLSGGRHQGVLQLLERLALLGNDLSERDGIVHVRAHMTAIAARIQGRSVVSDRTVRNWRRDAESLGLIRTDHRSHRFGRREWNSFAIDVAKIREWVGGNGRKWAETISAPGAETISGLGAETISAPSIGRETGSTHSPLARKTPDTQAASIDTRCFSAREVGCVFLKLGVGKASTLVAEALDRGCDTRSLMALARWFQRSQRANPKRWAKPSTVLMLRLTVADPGLPAWCGWIPGNPPPVRRHSSHQKPTGEGFYRERREAAAAIISSGPSTAELFQAALREKELSKQ